MAIHDQSLNLPETLHPAISVTSYQETRCEHVGTARPGPAPSSTPLKSTLPLAQLPVVRDKRGSMTRVIPALHPAGLVFWEGERSDILWRLHFRQKSINCQGRKKCGQNGMRIITRGGLCMVQEAAPCPGVSRAGPGPAQGRGGCGMQPH